MSRMKRLKIKYAVFIVVVISSLFLIHIVQAVSGDPGSDSNPLVAQDYVDARVSELTAKINELTATVSSLNQQIKNMPASQGAKFVIVEMKPGKQLVVGESTEMILRQGQANVVGSNLGGLSDVTAGVDIPTGGSVPPNHLLIALRDDGRGIIADSNSERNILVMVKGTYTVK